MKKIAVFFFFLMNVFIAKAQESSLDQEANDFLRNSSKLYVVISVLITIFAGIVIFLIFQDRKISRLEQKLKDKNIP